MSTIHFITAAVLIYSLVSVKGMLLYVKGWRLSTTYTMYGKVRRSGKTNLGGKAGNKGNPKICATRVL